MIVRSRSTKWERLKVNVTNGPLAGLSTTFDAGSGFGTFTWLHKLHLAILSYLTTITQFYESGIQKWESSTKCNAALRYRLSGTFTYS